MKSQILFLIIPMETQTSTSIRGKHAEKLSIRHERTRHVHRLEKQTFFRSRIPAQSLLGRCHILYFSCHAQTLCKYTF